LPQRELFVSADPSRVAEWCHGHLSVGVLYAAPSAAARGAAREAFLGARGVGVGARIVSAGGLVEALEARAGLSSRDAIPAPLRRLLLIEAGAAAGVPLFACTPPSGAVAVLGRLIRSLRLNGVTPDAYRDAGGDPRAATAYAAYEARRAALGVADLADRLARVTGAMPSLGAVILEDPVVPSRIHAEFYRALAERSETLCVGVPLLSALAADATSDAAGVAADAGSGTPGRAADGTPSAPSATARAFFLGVGLAETRDDAVPARPEMEPLAGVGEDGEVALVARRILRLLRDGTDPARVLGAAPTGDYLARLHEACASVGVPVSSPRRVDVTDVPLVRTLRAVFEALADPQLDTAERGLALLGAPYLGLKPRHHALVHRRLTLAGRGLLRSWKGFARVSERHPLRRLALAVDEMAAALAGPQPPDRFAALVSRLVLDFDFLASARRHYLAAGADDAVRADQQAWEAVQEALEQAGDAFARAGRATVSAQEWLAELTAALEGETVRVDHRGVRGVHLTVVGGGLPEADHVFAVGWSEGVFPRRPREDPFLPDDLKRRLNAAGARLPLTADAAAHDEERRERIVRAARRHLVVSWPQVAADGSPQLRSFFAQDVGVPPVRQEAAAAVGETTWPLDLAAGRAEELARAAVLVRHRAEPRLGDERAALDGLLTGLADDEVRALRGERHAPQRIAVPADLVPPIRRSAGRQSASQANRLAQCLYAHFAERRLEIEPLAAPEIGLPERGTVAHRVLAEVVLDALHDGAPGGVFDPVRAAAAFDRVWAEERPPHLVGDAQTAFERYVLRAQVLRLVELEREIFASAEARPVHAEFGFGMPPDDGERRDPASLPDGIVLALPAGSVIPSVMLRGSIDRVDVVEEDGRRFGVAVDYKSGKAERYAKKFTQRADFQVPVYCELLRRIGIEPVGAFYLGIPDGERHGIIREEYAPRFAVEDMKGVKRLSRDSFERRLATSLEALAGYAARAAVPEVVVEPRDGDCGWCDYAPLCRISMFSAVGAEGDDV
jgi:hypothetical protein